MPSEARRLVGHGFTRIHTGKEIRQNRVIRGLNFKIKSKGVNELQFQIRGKEYFLAFVEDEKRWYVFAPTADGMQRMPVYVDAVKYEKPGVLEEGTHNFSS
jgi:hypothetical protein